MPISRLLYGFAAFVFTVASAHAQSDCSIVYGKDWAFAFSTPAGWSSLCRAERLVGVPVAFWPVGSTFADSAVVMYVNVSTKVEPSLPDFVRSSQSLFRQKAPNVVFVPLEPIEATPKLRALHFSASGDPGGNVERITYVEGPTAYFVIVLSARTPKALEQAQPAFRQLLQSFIPMAATVPAIADNFAARVAEAKQAASSSDGARFDAALAPHIKAALEACIPPGSTDPSNLGAFSLVAYVSRDGVPNDVQVDPRTKVSTCFAERFSRSHLPVPPTHKSANGYPVLVEIRVNP